MHLSTLLKEMKIRKNQTRTEGLFNPTPLHFIVLVTLIVFGFETHAQKLIDEKATGKTRALYTNLKKISDKGFMFGHQDTDAYGVSWKAVDGRSDVKDICGSYPAVHGWDLGKLGAPQNIDSVNFANMIRWIKQVYKRGGINTISWHVDNPVSKGNTWDKTPAVKDILPGGASHAYYREQLDVLAEFFKKCKTGFTNIPLIFRPYHEHNGDWFWWGKGNCTEEEYKALWRFTVDYLRNEKKIHNLIYAFSPDRSRLNLDDVRASYLYGYPGDEYADMLCLDNYMDVGAKWNTKTREQQQADFARSLQTVSQLATEKNKVAALSETGLEGVTNPDWFTQAILRPIKKENIRIAYLLVWRNANTKHHYAPYPGHPAEKDFREFYNDTLTLFESDIQNMYKANKPLIRNERN